MNGLTVATFSTYYADLTVHGHIFERVLIGSMHLRFGGFFSGGLIIGILHYVNIYIIMEFVLHKCTIITNV